MSKDFPPITIPNSNIRRLKSEILGEEFQIFISLPENYEKKEKAYPVLYIVDANFAIGSVTEIVRMLSQGEFELPELIVVGIGYHLDHMAEVTALRWRDLTPTELSAEFYSSMQLKSPNTPPYAGSGGAGNLLLFIQEELKPMVDTEYRTKPGPENSTLWGDSLGGLFALYVLFHQPQAFQRYVIGSPSMWWDNEVTFQLEAAYAETHSDLPATVFLMVGGEEEPESIPQLKAYAMVSNVHKLDELLRKRNYPELDLTTHIFEGETHASVFTMGVARGLKVVFRNEVKGIEAFFEEKTE